MRLYSFQTAQVCSIIQESGEYIPEWDLINFKSEHSWGDGFEDAYLWMIDQYNERKGTNYLSPPVFWYTDLKQVKNTIHNIQPGEVLIFAEVPDEEVLLHNFDMWHEPLNHYPVCGSTNDDWWWEQGYRQVLAETRMDLSFKNHIKNKEVQEWVRDTWKNIFHIPRTQKHQFTVHAVTGCIKKEWLQPL